MKTQASGLKELEIRALAVHLTGKQPGGLIDPNELPNRCVFRRCSRLRPCHSGVLYAGTGNSYTDIATGGPDAIMAFELKTGKIRWINQVLANDNFLMNCRQPGVGNCPKDAGPDFDFGSSPILRTLPNGKQLLLAGHKSGVLFALDPDNQGKKLWEIKLGSGTALGGIEWGFTADATTAYVPIADPFGAPDKRKPGLSAVKIATGEMLRHAPAPAAKCAWGTQRCANAQSAAATLIPGVVFSGTADGHMRAYAARTISLRTPSSICSNTAFLATRANPPSNS